MNEDTFGKQAPVQAAAFKRLRRVGPDRADQAVIEVDGSKYRMFVDRPCSIETHHVTMECIDAPHHKVCMVAVRWRRRVPYGVEVDGLGLMMRALTEGLVVESSGAPGMDTWKILQAVWPPKQPRRRRVQG